MTNIKSEKSSIIAKVGSNKLQSNLQKLSEDANTGETGGSEEIRGRKNKKYLRKVSRTLAEGKRLAY